MPATCPNHHEVPDGATLCAACGAPVQPEPTGVGVSGRAVLVGVAVVVVVAVLIFVLT